jgi:hypothetical protein
MPSAASGPCPLWVKSGHMRRNKACPLYSQLRLQKRYLRFVMSALPPKADMCGAGKDVRYGPIADIVSRLPRRRG